LQHGARRDSRTSELLVVSARCAVYSRHKKTSGLEDARDDQDFRRQDAGDQ
jgi:hypothetical protein